MQTARVFRKLSNYFNITRHRGWLLRRPSACSQSWLNYSTNKSDPPGVDIGSDLNKTKSHKLEKLSTQADDSSDSSDSSGSDSDSNSSSSSDEEEIDEKLVAAAEEAAKSLPGDANTTKSDLLQRLQKHSKQTSEGAQPTLDLKSLVGSMKVSPQKQKSARGPQFGQRNDSQSQWSGDRERNVRRRGDFDGRDRRARVKQPGQGTILDKLDIFNSKPLGIFPSVTETKDITESSEISLYDRIEKELQQASMTYPPRNGFEEMSRWTKQGKMWHYPIDNEQGLEEEVHVGFHEHVFLDQLLNEFPKKGPVRHFMELVITGLSKNPYYTATEKRDHIEWYTNYFSDKYTIIDELTISAKSQGN